MLSPYKILGVKSTSSLEEIKLAYRKLSKLYHPDNLKTGDSAKFQAINKAWNYINSNHKNPTISHQKGVWRHKSLFTIYKEEM